MYVRKPTAEIKEERAPRKGRKGAAIYAVVFFLLVLVDYRFGPYGHRNSWEAVLTKGVLLASLGAGAIYFFMKGQFAYTGNFKGNNDLVCLSCGKVFVQRSGYTSNVLLAFGQQKKKWWQIQACSTPVHCDIANMNDVNWIDDETNNGEPEGIGVDDK